MIRVLELATRFEIGGSEGQLVHLLEAIDRERFDPRAACLRRSGALLARLDACRVPVAEYPAPHLYGLSALHQQLRLASHLRGERVDVVHALGFYSNVFAIPAARLAGTPVVIGSVREQASHWTPAQTAANHVALSLAHCIVVNASSVRDELIGHGFPPHKLRLIRNGVDCARFALPRRPGGLRDELGWPAGTPIVAVISRIAPRKGLEQFLDAAREVTGADHEVRFLVVGDGPVVQVGQDAVCEYRRRLEARAVELGLGDVVRFTGWRHDVPELLAQIDVSVVPSLSEALSNSLLESLAAAAPVVATRVGDHPRVVEHGVSGLLVPPDDRDALAKRILQLLGDRALAARVGEAGRDTVVTRFSLERMVADTEALYEELVARKRRTTPRPPRLEVDTVDDAEGLRALEQEWSALHATVGHDHPFVTHEWVESWWRAFGADRRLEIAVARQRGECVGIAPLMQSPARMYGVPVECLELIGNVHTPRNDLLCAEPAAYDALFSHIRARASWDVLVLPQLADGSPTIDAISRLAADHHVRSALWAGSESPVLRLAGDRESFERSLSAKMRANLRNKARRLTALGSVELETITGGPGLAAALDDGLRLEAAAWKGANGTAIVSNDDVRRFYTLLAHAMAARGWLELRFLTVGGRRIAFGYCLRYRGTLFVLKQGFDPELASYSPGMVFWQRVIAESYRQRLGAIDFLGDAEEWKLSWGCQPHRHYWLYGFAPNPRARLVHALKFGVAPVLRERRERAAASLHA